MMYGPNLDPHCAIPPYRIGHKTYTSNYSNISDVTNIALTGMENTYQQMMEGGDTTHSVPPDVTPSGTATDRILRKLPATFRPQLVTNESPCRSLTHCQGFANTATMRMSWNWTSMSRSMIICMVRSIGSHSFEVRINLLLSFVDISGSRSKTGLG